MAYPPPRKRLTGGVLAVVAGVIVLVVLLCCVGGIALFTGDDEPEPTDTAPGETSTSATQSPTSTSSSTSSTSETVTDTESTNTETTDTDPTETETEPSESSEPGESGEPSEGGDTDAPSPSTPGLAPSVTFPDSFGEWTKSDSASDTLAIYRKGEDEALSVVTIPRDQVEGFYDRIWEDTSKHDEVTCGKLSTSANYQCVGVVDGNGVLVSGSSETAAETAEILTALLAAIADA